MSKIKILILSDSLALPRESPEAVDFESVWPSLLRSNENFVIHQVSIGGGTSSDILRQINYHKAFFPDVIILQVGIVDCAPRFVTKFETEILRRVPYLGSKLLASLNKPFVRKHRNITYVPLSKFKSNITKISRQFIGSRILCIGIMPVFNEYEMMLPGMRKNEVEYNGVLRTLFKNDFIDVSNFPKEALMSDHHHLSSMGHQLIAQILKGAI